MKSEKNKTIDISVEDGRQYLDRCLFFDEGRGFYEGSKESETGSDFNDPDFFNNRIIAGDSLKIAAAMPKGFVDLLIADPPYNLDKQFHGYNFHEMASEAYEKYTEGWVEAVRPLLKENASIYVCCDWKSSGAIERVLARYFTIQNRITWQREKGRGAKANWKNAMEDIWFCTVSEKSFTFNIDDVKQRRRVVAPYKVDGQPKDWEETSDGNFRNTCPSNFWDDISVPYWSMAENTAHPTQKPEKLLAKLILASSNKGDIVFDPFMGSGSTAVTAKKLGRNFCGSEMNLQYCVWAQKRLEMAEQDKSIQGYANGVFWERNTNGLQKQSVK
ncbi:MAG: site-specific DNA-methyltransferase [Treponema sp.]|nr:site-specific DNA-methyltransferase [Treponema sp.]